MIKQFTSNGYMYTLKGSGLDLSMIKINGKDLTHYLAYGTKVGEYDVSVDSGRKSNANGVMVLNVVATKYRIDMVTRPLTDDEQVDFFKEIRKNPVMTVEFLNPFTKEWDTITCYRGDRGATPHMPFLGEKGYVGLIYDGVTQAIIEM